MSTLAPEPSLCARDPRSAPPRGPLPGGGRPQAMGKFIFAGGEKLLVRGVTYGPLCPDADGCAYPAQAVERDFAAMAAAGVNAVRTYTVPPPALLDAAARHGLWVLVGLPWEQHVAFLQDLELQAQIEARVRDGVRSCAGHAALLGFAIGNEVPSGVVRWHGHRRIERYIRRLYRAAKEEDPGALVTYVNYPSTEYLELPFLDVACFNVYLERPKDMDAYLARLQNLAGDKPLILAETGLDSRRNGEAAQAAALDWQLRLAAAAGCAGCFVFAWTDEWHRNACEVVDWDFGVTRRDRTPKPALAALQQAYAELPFPPGQPRPRFTVAVCTHRGSATLGECLEGLARLRYPDVEVLVVNDGACPDVRAIAGRFPVRLIDVPHAGLSVARNTALAAATGEFIAYVDDDAWPDPDWLLYLVHAFATLDCAAAGGPNIPPPPRGMMEECVALAPGGPIHVLLTDREAEHIPGCNMAFRVSALRAIGGFDPQFRVAGDDVDLCWRLHDAGLRIGFHAGASVWHRRRGTLRAYWRQQVGYGRAEAMLERKWPAKYNAAGQPGWVGRIYGHGRMALQSWRRSRIYHGTWGSALFQSLYEPAPNHFWSLARMPEWYLVILLLSLMLVMGRLWTPMNYAWIPLLAAIAVPVAQAGLAARRVSLAGWPRSAPGRGARRLLVALLFAAQPMARLVGRLGSGLTPWRSRLRGRAMPWPRIRLIWSDAWRSPVAWLEALETPLEQRGATVYRGGDFDRWDLEVRGGLFGSMRLRVLIEEHGSGRQMVRISTWPRWPLVAGVTCLLPGLVALGALRDGSWHAAAVFGAAALLFILATVLEWSSAAAAIEGAVRDLRAASEGRFSGGAPTP